MSDLSLRELQALAPDVWAEPYVAGDRPLLSGVASLVGPSRLALLGQRVAAYAAGQIGTVEKPLGSNRVPYWDVTRPGFQGEPWCAAFNTACWLQVGVDLRKLFGSGNSFYCPSLRTMAISRGVWRSADSGYSPAPGDLVLYGRGSLPYHTGLAAPDSGSYVGYRAIEGNTSPGTAGSQANGVGVYRRDRALSMINGWVDMGALVGQMERDGLASTATAQVSPGVVSSTTTAATPTAKPQFSLSRLLQGVRSGEPSGNVLVVQEALHRRYSQARYPGAASGRWTSKETAIYAALQRDCGYTGADADGVPGADSLRNLLPGYEVVA